MPTYNNHWALMDAIESDLVDILTLVRDGTIEIIHDKIQEIVYDPYTPSEPFGYKRLGYGGGFIGSWIGDLKQNSKSNYDMTIFSSPDDNDMFYEYGNIWHGGYKNLNRRGQKGNYTAVDRRKDMDRIIAEGAGTGEYDFFVPSTDDKNNWWLKPRDYWTPIISDLDAGVFDILVLKAFADIGINDVQTI